jgi:hypothetical protein
MALLAIGCYAPPPPIAFAPLPASMAGPRDACLALKERNLLDLSFGEQQEVRAAHATLRRLLPVRVEIAVRDFDAIDAQLKQPLLRGEVVPIALRVLLEGPHAHSVEWFLAKVAARHDGTLYENAADPPGDRGAIPPPHDAVRALFARGAPPPMSPEDQRTTAVGAKGDGMKRLEQSDAREKLSYLAACSTHDRGAPCEALVPLARAAPSLGPDELLVELFFSLPGTPECQVSDLRAVPLPPGATLEERLRALFAEGSVVLGGEAQAGR